MTRRRAWDQITTWLPEITDDVQRISEIFGIESVRVESPDGVVDTATGEDTVGKREKFLLRVQRGALVPHDEHTQKSMREKGYKVGDVLSAELTKPRNPGFHNLAHAIGDMVAENIAEFEGMDAHQVLKRLQLEAGVKCDEMVLRVPSVGLIPYKVPQSLSFASMDQGEFHEVVKRVCQHISDTYWKTLSPEQVEDMARKMPEVQ